MSEPELLKRIAELEARNLELLAENDRFWEIWVEDERMSGILKNMDYSLNWENESNL